METPRAEASQAIAAGAGGQSAAHHPALSRLSVDRRSEVPIGVQLAWAIRAQIDDGALGAGERLPGLRDLAEALAVNANTVRAVYARLEREGLLETRHGSGTFVAAVVDRQPKASAIASEAAQKARRAGIDPRQIAATIYVQASHPAPPSQARRRAQLRAQIAVLDQTLSELEVEHPGLADAAHSRLANRLSRGTGKARIEARLPSAAELEQTKRMLLAQIAKLQASIGELAQDIERVDAATAHSPKPASRAPSRRRKPVRPATSEA